ncbi:hypothetical protein [Halorubrum sp. CBA1229]|uniref:hypothetical protein n=1 Tax=Halorubrum sp. CBA1229 TaxID=1853699 RepID=UPI0011CDF01E|nr:hypothetical protein [Halorubrum sp. CBA1229]QKY15560.1 hypothetical protein Hrr1229_001170 [Halorubrum sp. CBA1229]
MNSSIETLFTGLRHPNRAVKYILSGARQTVQNAYFRLKYGDGIDVTDRDWDNLILLDACRYDYFKEENHIEGDLEPVVSKGSRSWEFMMKNFEGNDLSDTVYVTANPFADQLSDDIFYTVEPVFHDWYDDAGTVRPEKIVEAARSAQELYPQKRLIIHFMQPHDPYLGNTGAELRDRFNLHGWNKYHGHNNKEHSQSGNSVWDKVKTGEISHETLRTAYRENLNLVLEHADTLVTELDGRTVITADHGELLGDQWIGPQYGHPGGVYTEDLCIVPWLVIESETRRVVKSEDPIGFDRLDETTRKDRLRDLGYIT